MVYFSALQQSFIPEAWKIDGTYSAENWPKDAVLLTDEERIAYWKVTPPEGRVLGTALGRPVWVDVQMSGIEIVYQQQLAAINGGCESAITAGFWSDALGVRNFYGSQIGDQLNLTGAVMSGADLPYPCRSEDGTKGFPLHTSEQLKAVSSDFAAFKLPLLQKANVLKVLLDEAFAAGDSSLLLQVVWESEQ